MRLGVTARRYLADRLHQRGVLPNVGFIGFEGEARSSWNYESLFVPGLLQTEDYARAVITGVLPFASRDEVERRVEVRMERQEVLRNENPLELWGIVDEAALRRQVGSRAVMRAQLRHLLGVVTARAGV